jgi:hypothetical protein
MHVWFEPASEGNRYLVGQINGYGGPDAVVDHGAMSNRAL